MNSNIKNHDSDQRSGTSNEHAGIAAASDDAGGQRRLASVIVQELGEAEADIGFFARRT